MILRVLIGQMPTDNAVVTDFFRDYCYLYRGLSGGVACCPDPRCLGPLLKDIFFKGLGEIPCSAGLSCVSLLNQTLLPSEAAEKKFRICRRGTSMTRKQIFRFSYLCLLAYLHHSMKNYSEVRHDLGRGLSVLRQGWKMPWTSRSLSNLKSLTVMILLILKLRSKFVDQPNVGFGKEYSVWNISQ